MNGSLKVIEYIFGIFRNSHFITNNKLSPEIFISSNKALKKNFLILSISHFNVSYNFPSI